MVSIAISLEPFMGGVNHYSLHCRLAKIRGLMYGVKYSAVIGRKLAFLHVPSMQYIAGYRQSQRCI
jgi:hypothetical protein